MKAVIVGIKGRYAAALTRDGRIVRIRNCGYTVGQTVDPKALTSAPPLKKAVTWVAAAAAALALCIGGGSLYATPYAFVSLDVNPSVEYVLNRFDRVLSVTAVNDDGAAILEDVRLTNKSIDDAVRMTLNRIADEGYFGEAKTNGLLIATSCGNEKASEQLALRLEKKAQEETGSLNAEVQVAAVTVSQEKVEEAKFLGVTPGKLDLVEQLKASAEDPDSIDTAVWLSQPVGEIMNEIKATQEGLPQLPDDMEEDASSSESEAGTPSPEASSPQKENGESASPAVDPINPLLPGEAGESSLPDESSGSSSEGSLPLVDVEDPLGKQTEKEKNDDKWKEGVGGTVIPSAS